MTAPASTDSGLPAIDVEGVLAALGLPPGEEESAVPYTVIRGSSGPRWLLPEKSRMTRTILREWRPYGPATRFFWLGLRWAERLGVLPLAPGTGRARLSRGCGAGLLRRFEMETDASPPVILVGNAHATRKLLVFLFAEAAGNVVVKIPLTPLARASLANEAEVLRRLNGEHGAPRLLGYHSDTGAALQEYLHGAMGSRRLRPNYLRILIDLARRGETVTLASRASGLRERLLRAGHSADFIFENGTASASQAPIERALALLGDDTRLPAVLAHGDFTPWNIRELADGRCTLIDWESAEWTGLPLHDLCQFFSMQAKLFAPRKLFAEALERDRAWKKYCAALDIEPRFFRPLVAAFLLESMMRSLEWGPKDSAAYYLDQLKRFL